MEFLIKEVIGPSGNAIQLIQQDDVFYIKQKDKDLIIALNDVTKGIELLDKCAEALNTIA